MFIKNDDIRVVFVDQVGWALDQFNSGKMSLQGFVEYLSIACKNFVPESSEQVSVTEIPVV